MPEKITAAELDIEGYHKHPALSNSQISDFIKNKAFFKYKHLLKIAPDKTTPAKRRGTIFHAMILEPEKIADLFRVMPESFPTKKECGITIEEQKLLLQQECETQKIALVSNTEYAVALEASEALATAPENKWIYETFIEPKGECESSFFWQDAASGLNLRCRPDKVMSDGSYLVDVKFSRSADKEDFSRAIAEYGYHRQASVYLDGVEAVSGKRPAGMVFIVVENTFPYSASCFVLCDRAISKGKEEVSKALLDIKECAATQKYPAYPEQAQLIDLPAWHYKE